jgi:hypothetical protein
MKWIDLVHGRMNGGLMRIFGFNKMLGKSFRIQINCWESLFGFNKMLGKSFRVQ